jgi:hypothetical protein
MLESDTRIWDRPSSSGTELEESDLIETSWRFLGLTPYDILALEQVYRENARRRGLRDLSG